MTLFDLLTHYLNNCKHFVHCIQMEKPALKLKIVNEMMYLCHKNCILEKIEIAFLKALPCSITKGLI